MSATVTGAFVILDRASRPIRRIRDEAIEADLAVKSLGSNLDKIGTRDQRQMMQNTAGHLRTLGEESGIAAHATEALDKELGKAGAPQHARNIATSATAIRDTGRAARDADRPISEVTRGVRNLGNEGERTKNRLAKFGGEMLGLRQVMMVMLIPAIGLATQGLSSLGAGFVELLPRLTQLSGLAAPAATALTGVGLAAITAKLAFSDLSKAWTGNKRAMQNLTPEAKSFLTTLREYKPLMQELRQSAQRGLFPGLELGLRRMAAAAPLARTLLREMGQRLGSLAANAAGQFTQRGFLRDLEMIGGQGMHIVTQLGRGVLNLVQAFRHFLVAGLPFTHWLTDTIYGWTEWAKGASRAGRESGRLTAFFDRTRASLEVLGHIARNMFTVVHGILHAATGESNRMYASIDAVTKRWADWTSSAHGQQSMRDYFQQMREPLHQLVLFVGDLTRALGHMAMGSGFTQAMEALRGALPALSQGLSSLASNFGPVLFQTLGNVVQLLSTVTGAGGPLSIMLTMLNGVLTTFNSLIRHIPALGPILAVAFSVLAINRFSSGLTEIAGKWLGIARNARAAETAQTEALAAGTGAGMGLGGRAGPTTTPIPIGRRYPAGAVPVGMEEYAANVAGPVTRGAVPAGMEGYAASLAYAERGRLGRFWSRMRGRMGPRLGAARTALGRVPGGLARGAGAAAGFMLPVLGIQALTGIAGTQGNALQRLEGGAQSLTFGMVNTPITGSDYNRQGLTRGAGWLRSNLGARFNPANRATMAARTAQINAEIAHQQSRLDSGGTSTWQHGLLFGKADTREVQGRIAALRAELRHEADLVYQARQQEIAVAKRQGSQLAIGFGEAFQVYDRAHGIHYAMRQTTDDVLGQMRRMGPVGRQALAQNMLEWAHEQAQANPKLWGQYQSLRNQLQGEFDKLNQHVRIVNGQIIDGSRQQWSQLSDILGSPAEKAAERVSRALTGIQQEAIAALSLMGYTGAEARQAVMGQDPNTTPAQRRSMNKQAASSHPSWAAGPTGATGMRVPGARLGDRVPMFYRGGGGIAGFVDGQELVINRHGEVAADRLLGKAGALASIVNATRTPHTQTFSTGGRNAQPIVAGNTGAGTAAGLHQGIAQAVGQVLSHFPGLSITSTTGGQHAAGSYHYRGEAADIGGSPALMNRAAQWIGRTMGAGLTEGIHNPNLSIKNGQHVASSFWGPAVWAEHANHIHLAIAGAFNAMGLPGFAGGGGGGAAARIRLARMVAPGGVPAAMEAAAHNRIAGAMERVVNRRLGQLGGGGAGALAAVPGTGGSNTANMALGRRMMLTRWGADQWPALRALWTRESGWNANAVNATSGAMGIPQALGHGNVFRLGDARSQIAWGLNYIAQRYGSPSAAWGHEQSAGWYGQGGRIPGWGGWFQTGGRGRFRRPTVIGVGDAHVPEEVNVTPVRPIAGATQGTGGGRVVHVHFHPGAIVIQGGGHAAGKAAADAIVEHVAAALENMGMESEVSIST